MKLNPKASQVDISPAPEKIKNPLQHYSPSNYSALNKILPLLLRNVFEPLFNTVNYVL